MHLTSVLETLCGALVGLCLGRFLNVLIHRLPQRMAEEEDQALSEALQARGLAALSSGTAGQAEGQGHSRLRASCCPHCLQGLRWWHQMPLIGFVMLRGRCAHCSQPMAWRYPLVEWLAGLWLGWCCARWGLSPQAMAVGGAGLALLALASIDAQHLLLPDAITLPLLWAGLLCATTGWHALPLQDAVWGAALGYALMASMAWLFWRLTGKEGLGGGDFKLFAALGAWQGWMALPWLLLIACLGSVAWVVWRQQQGRPRQLQYPFGPWLALAGGLHWLAG